MRYNACLPSSTPRRRYSMKVAAPYDFISPAQVLESCGADARIFCRAESSLWNSAPFWRVSSAMPSISQRCSQCERYRELSLTRTQESAKKCSPPTQGPILQAEALTRDLEGFARFLRYCAAASGQHLDMTRLATEAHIKRASAIRFFEILEDTLIAFRCDAFAKSERRRLIQHPRFFLFDNGVLNGLLGNFRVSDDRKGMLFEHFVITQVYHTAKAVGGDIRLSNYRTEHGAELDLIIERSDGVTIAVECKSGSTVRSTDLEGFKSFASFFKRPHRKIVIYGGTTPRRIDDVDILPYQIGIREIFR